MGADGVVCCFLTPSLPPIHYVLEIYSSYMDDWGAVLRG